MKSINIGIFWIMRLLSCAMQHGTLNKISAIWYIYCTNWHLLFTCHRNILHQCTFGHFYEGKKMNIRNICTNAICTDQGHCFDVEHTLLAKLNSWHPNSQSHCVLISILLPFQRYLCVHVIDSVLNAYQHTKYWLGNIANIYNLSINENYLHRIVNFIADLWVWNLYNQLWRQQHMLFAKRIFCKRKWWTSPFDFGEMLVNFLNMCSI